MISKHNKRYLPPGSGNKILDGETTVDLARVAECKHCFAGIVWLESVRTGKKYPVNFHGALSHSGHAIITRNDFHHCPCRPAQGLNNV